MSQLTTEQIATIESIRQAFFAANGKAEPAPWVPKFKVGDRVKVKPIGTEGVGDVLMVVNTYRMNVQVTDLDDKPDPRTGAVRSGRWFSEEELILEPAPDPLADVKAAYARGEVIQIFSMISGWTDLGKHEIPKWYPGLQYRVKPTDPQREAFDAFYGIDGQRYLPITPEDVKNVAWAAWQEASKQAARA